MNLSCTFGNLQVKWTVHVSAQTVVERAEPKSATYLVEPQRTPMSLQDVTSSGLATWVSRALRAKKRRALCVLLMGFTSWLVSVPFTRYFAISSWGLRGKIQEGLG